MNRDAFFAGIHPLFKSGFRQPQVDGIDAILDEWERRKLGDIRFLAYMFATTYHETGFTMQPISERGGAAYFTKHYEGRRDLGNTVKGDGARFHGRGYVQLTGRRNYSRMSDLCGVDMVANPDLALQPSIAAKVMFEGMIGGLFTGKKLADYIGRGGCDYKNARKIINGLDKAVAIAGYARIFENALIGAELVPALIRPGPVAAPPAREPDMPRVIPLPPDFATPESRQPAPAGFSLWAAIKALFGW